ncbi:hypothetical protein [Nostoc sp.]
MHDSSSWGATFSSVQRRSGVETPSKAGCLVTTLAHRTRKFES